MNTGRISPPGPPRRSGRALLRPGAYVLAGLLLLCAAVLVGVRLLLPEVRHFRAELGEWASRTIGQRVEIGTIDAWWHGWTPMLRLGDIRFVTGEGVAGAGVDTAVATDSAPGSDDETATDARAYPPARLTELTFSIDLPESLRSRTLRPRGIVAGGASVAVVRRTDGALSVTGLGELSSAETRAGEQFARWALSQESVSLRSSRILWIDEQRRMDALPLDGVTLHVRREGDRRLVSGEFRTPGDGRIEFTMDVAGDPLTTSWSGSVYASAAGIELDRLGITARPLGTARLSGRISGKVWSTWERARLVEAEGTIHALSPGFASGASRQGFDELGASFRAERTTHGWTLATRDLAVTTPNGKWPPSTAGAVWTPPRDGRYGTFVVNMDFVRIEDLVALLPPDRERSEHPVLDALLAAGPRGAIEQLRVSAPVAEDVEFEHASARGRFTRLRAAPEGSPVSIDEADGRFEASAQGVVVDVDRGNLLVNAPRWLSRPLPGGKLTGAFIAMPGPDGLRVRFDGTSVTTPAGTVAAQGWVLAPRDGSEPELSIVLEAGASRIDTLRALLAEDALPRPVARWFETAAPDGDVRGLRLLFHGRPSELPSGAGAGRIEAAMLLALPVFRYASGWPEITGTAGVVRFDGARLDVRVESGRIFGVDIRNGAATIEDVGAEAPVVRVTGRGEGPIPDAARFLVESPLRAQFAELVENVTIRGDGAVDLALSLPLGAGTPPATVEGTLSLDGNRVDVTGLDRGFEAVTGTIAFRDGGIESDGISATYLGEPVRAVVGAAPGREGATRVSIDGRTTRRHLAAHLHNTGLVDTPLPEESALLARIGGEASWNATLDVLHARGDAPRSAAPDPPGTHDGAGARAKPRDGAGPGNGPPARGDAGNRAEPSAAPGLASGSPAGGDTAARAKPRTGVDAANGTRIRGGAGDRATLRVTVDLAGVSLDLPPPFGKAKGTARTLGVESRIGSAERTTRIRYGDLAGAVFRLVPDGDRPRIERGAIRLGATPATLPDTPGVTVRAALPALDADAWSALDTDVSSAFFDDDAARDEPADRAPLLETVREISIDTASLIAIGARFPDTRIRAARGADGAWRLDLAGPRLEGEIRIPADPGAGPVIADFEHAVFERDSGEPRDERPRLDPRTLPALSFSTRRLVFQGLDLGRVTFATAPFEHGTRLERLHMPAGSFEGNATGEWSLIDDEHRTRFEMEVHGDDLGRMLGALGYDDSAVAGGATEISMRGSWAGTPADFALERLNGTMRLRSGEGRLRQLRRGVTGRVFGLLTITSLPRRLILDFSDFFRSGFEYDRIEGSFVIERGDAHTADLFMDSDTARFEVVGRTGLTEEDYDKIVTVIPKLSSILLLAPIGLVQKIFNTEGFDESFAYQYTITGTWDEPVIEPVRAQRPGDEIQGRN